jgi:hypothetical protein
MSPRVAVLVVLVQSIVLVVGWRKVLDDEPGLLYVGMVLYTLALGLLGLCYLGNVLITGKW